jgi:hypothetical protein
VTLLAAEILKGCGFSRAAKTQDVRLWALRENGSSASWSMENVIVSSKTRWIAAVTGCLTAIAGLPALGYLSVLTSAFLILGAALVGHFPRHGRDLMWFGAGATSLWAIPMGSYLLRFSLERGRDPRVTVAALALVLLVGWCDAVLVADAKRESRAAKAAND